MGKKAYLIDLYDGDNTIQVALRLTLDGQEKLVEQDPDGSVLENVLDAISNPRTMRVLLTECLNYRGNNNSIRDGGELYDLLVDNGYEGQKSFGEIIMAIARSAGLLNQNDVERINRIFARVSKMQSDVLDQAGQDPQEGQADPLFPRTLDG